LWLLGAGWRVETAADGWQAIQKIRDRVFEAAVIDLDLPHVHGLAMDGWDLVRILRAYHPGIPIVVLTAETGPDVKLRAEDLRVSQLLEKPIRAAPLHALVATLEAEIRRTAGIREGGMAGSVGREPGSHPESPGGAQS
jgi:CheY-like chemotaxis protein